MFTLLNLSLLSLFQKIPMEYTMHDEERPNHSDLHSSGSSLRYATQSDDWSMSESAVLEWVAVSSEESLSRFSASRHSYMQNRPCIKLFASCTVCGVGNSARSLSTSRRRSAFSDNSVVAPFRKTCTSFLRLLTSISSEMHLSWRWVMKWVGLVLRFRAMR